MGKYHQVMIVTKIPNSEWRDCNAQLRYLNKHILLFSAQDSPLNVLSRFISEIIICLTPVVKEVLRVSQDWLDITAIYYYLRQ